MSFSLETEVFESYKCQNTEKHKEYHTVKQKAGANQCRGHLLCVCVCVGAGVYRLASVFSFLMLLW